MPKTLLQIATLQWCRVVFATSRFDTIFRVQLMRDDLKRLCKWAQRKRLKPIYLHYKRIHANTEVLLAEFRIRFPRIYGMSEIAYLFYGQLVPIRTYYKGSAARYRSRN